MRLTNKLKLIFNLILIFIAVPLIINGCEGQEGSQGEQGSPGPLLVGNLEGICSLIDEYGIPVDDNSGITISIDNTDYTTETDAEGYWLLENLSTGTYSISFSKPGFCLSKEVDYQFVGGGTDYFGEEKLVSVPEHFDITLGNPFDRSCDSTCVLIYIPATVNPLPEGDNKSFIKFFIGLNNAVSSDPEHYIYTTTWDIDSSGSADCILATNLDLLYRAGIKSGTIIYIVGYPTTRNGISGDRVDTGYVDTRTGKWVYTNIEDTPSNIQSIQLP